MFFLCLVFLAKYYVVEFWLLKYHQNNDHKRKLSVLLIAIREGAMLREFGSMLEEERKSWAWDFDSGLR